MANAQPAPSCEVQALSDDELLSRVGALTRCSRSTEVDLLVHLGEVDARRLYAREACASMFAWCTERLHFSEGEASLRIAAARAGREHPVVLRMLADGRLHLSAAARLGPHLTAENRDAVLQRAVHRPKREILELVAELNPRPDAPERIRRLPEPRPAPGRAPLASPAAVLPAMAVEPAAAAPSQPALAPCLDTVDRPVSPDCPSSLARVPLPARPGTVEPTAPGRYKVQFTASAAFREKLDRLRALMRTTVPDGDLATILEQAVAEKLARLERRRFGATAPRSHAAREERPEQRDGASERAGRAGSRARSEHAPQATEQPRDLIRPPSRDVPAHVRRAVAERDGRQCTYLDEHGRRCSATLRLEFHHGRPFAYGGEPSVDNIALMCRTHNRLLAEADFGIRVVSRRRGSA